MACSHILGRTNLLCLAIGHGRIMKIHGLNRVESNGRSDFPPVSQAIRQKQGLHVSCPQSWGKECSRFLQCHSQSGFVICVLFFAVTPSVPARSRKPCLESAVRVTGYSG